MPADHNTEQYLAHWKEEKISALDAETQQAFCNVATQTLRQLEHTADILRCPSRQLLENNPIRFVKELAAPDSIACQGTQGAYSHIAAERLFPGQTITFYTDFEEVVRAVTGDNLTYGILPLENSSAGSVEEAAELVYRYRCYIHTVISIPVQHCLAATAGSSMESIKTVYSHPQALRQCGGYLKGHHMQPEPFTNTAAAAAWVAKNQNTATACICSELAAQYHGLTIVDRDIQDYHENYTRFMCFAKDALILPAASIVSITISFANEPGALERLLTTFSALNLDLCKIQSMPLGGSDFLVRFHLDFHGSIRDARVENLLGHMYETYDNFQFLGNYTTI